MRTWNCLPVQTCPCLASVFLAGGPRPRTPCQSDQLRSRGGTTRGIRILVRRVPGTLFSELRLANWRLTRGRDHSTGHGYQFIRARMGRT